MKASKYNYYYELSNKNLVLFNTFSGAIIKINYDIYEHINGNIDCINDSTKQKLSKLGILIPDDCDEEKVIEFDRAKNIYSSETVIYRILTTTVCNARCFYCYEAGLPKEYMDLETAQRTVEFIKSHTIGAKKIKIQWFGGEPLLNCEVIYYITNNLKAHFESLSKTCEFSMITNGYLIDTVDLQKMHLSRVQIAIDGDKDEYNSRKQYIYSGNPFNKVIENINFLSENNIDVSIRLNYDKANYDNMLKLIPLLNRQLLHKNRIHIYPYPLFGTYCEHKNCYDGTTKLELFTLIKTLCKYNLTSMKQLCSLRYRPSRCFACNSNSFVIGANGELYKCTSDLTNNVGSVYSNVNFNENFFKWCNISVLEKCRKCIFLPLCQGGCMAGQLNLLPVTCFQMKNIIDDVLEIIVNQKPC